MHGAEKEPRDVCRLGDADLFPPDGHGSPARLLLTVPRILADTAGAQRQTLNPRVADPQPNWMALYMVTDQKPGGV